MGRAEGPARSEGDRIFISDFHTRNIDEWKKDTLEAILVCSRTLEHEMKPWDNAPLPEAIRPDFIFQPSKDKQSALSKPGDMPFFATTGKTPDFFGQPIAIAFYADYETSFFASQHLRELSQFEGKYQARPELARRFSLDDDLEAWKLLQLPEKSVSPVSFLKTDDNWPAVEAKAPSLKPEGKPKKLGLVFHKESAIDELAWEAFYDVRKRLQGPTSYHHRTRTQLGDNAFLEPESGLAWYDKANKTLHLRLGSQNIFNDVENAASAVKNYFGLEKGRDLTIEATNHDMGGGFGGRNGSLFASYLAIAAVHAEGRPVRLRWDRFQQFLLGLKRHSSVVESTIRVNPATMKFEAFEAFLVLGAGVHVNLTGSIVSLGTSHLTGPYNIPFTSLHGVGSLRPHTPCGPSRGFGIPQACLHIETLVDRVAHDLKVDPIELRKINLFAKGNRDPSGYELMFHVANSEVLERAAAHPIWQERHERQRQMQARGISYGVGFAASMEAYGSSSDPVFGAVELTADGRVVVHSDMSEMGQGSRTSIALTIESLLGLAPDPDEINLSDATFFHKTFPKDLKGGSSTASKTAFAHLHPIREACDMLMQKGFLEAARRILGLAALPKHGVWKSDGTLHIDGGATIARADLMARMREDGLWTGVNCHAYFKNGWLKTGKINGEAAPGRFIDALAVQRGFKASWAVQTVDTVAQAATLQRSLYASAAHLIEITVDRVSGQLSVLSCHSILDAGDVISQPIVEGQAEGGFAMGLGFAMSEQIPEDPRNADFMNFHTYRAPRFRALAPIRHTLEMIALPAGQSILNEGQPMARSKGIAEAVMTTVAPALANALAHASGNYDWLKEVQLPITRRAVLAAFKDAE